MRTKIVALAVCATLAACDTTPPKPTSPPEDIGAELTNSLWAFHQHNIQELIKYLGYPTSQQQIAGDVVYVWSYKQNMPDLYGNPTAFTAYCNIQAGTDVDGTIKNTHWDGNRLGCTQYAHALPR